MHPHTELPPLTYLPDQETGREPEIHNFPGKLSLEIGQAALRGLTETKQTNMTPEQAAEAYSKVRDTQNDEANSAPAQKSVPTVEMAQNSGALEKLEQDLQKNAARVVANADYATGILSATDWQRQLQSAQIIDMQRQQAHFDLQHRLSSGQLDLVEDDRTKKKKKKKKRAQDKQA